jgi:hypothetical protein
VFSLEQKCTPWRRRGAWSYNCVAVDWVVSSMLWKPFPSETPSYKRISRYGSYSGGHNVQEYLQHSCRQSGPRHEVYSHRESIVICNSTHIRTQDIVYMVLTNISDVIIFLMMGPMFNLLFHFWHPCYWHSKRTYYILVLQLKLKLSFNFRHPCYWYSTTIEIDWIF